MPNPPLPTLPRQPPHHRAKASLVFGRRARMSASVRITSPGIVSIAVLVSSILLSTAVLVHTAKGVRRSREG